MNCLTGCRRRRHGIIAVAVTIVVVLSRCDSLTGVTAYLEQQVAGTEGTTPVSPAAVSSLSYYCSYDTCLCSADLTELTCRGVYFTRVPTPLPTTLVKL
jgi:hypothetical protein